MQTKCGRDEAEKWGRVCRSSMRGPLVERPNINKKFNKVATLNKRKVQWPLTKCGNTGEYVLRGDMRRTPWCARVPSGGAAPQVTIKSN